MKYNKEALRFKKILNTPSSIEFVEGIAVILPQSPDTRTTHAFRC